MFYLEPDFWQAIRVALLKEITNGQIYISFDTL